MIVEKLDYLIKSAFLKTSWQKIKMKIWFLIFAVLHVRKSFSKNLKEIQKNQVYLNISGLQTR